MVINYLLNKAFVPCLLSLLFLEATKDHHKNTIMYKTRIGQTQWAGNVEMHLKSSEWLAHNHQNDEAYRNVILHVVMEEDRPIFRKDGSRIPCLEMKKLRLFAFSTCCEAGGEFILHCPEDRRNGGRRVPSLGRGGWHPDFCYSSIAVAASRFPT